MANTTVPLPSSAAPQTAPAIDRAPLYRARLAGSVLMLALLLAVTAGMLQLATPAVAPRTAPPSTFSAARAMQHLQEIAREPHPIGSPANARVRDYLVAQLQALQVAPQVQTAVAVQERYGMQAGTVHNVVARIPGTQPGAAIMLAAHYDSVPTSPGASDDGAAVAAMLETARALTAGAPLQHDVILLFTDGEEAGMLGARAFMDEHPWAKEVALTLNFEARGSRGPAVMFETNAGNRAVIREFAQAAPYPVAYSFVSTIFGQMPNGTDLMVFKELPTQALNFGYLFDWPAYHSRRDSLDTIDPRSLQHHGSHMLALTQQYGNRPLIEASDGDAVFFTLWPGVLVHYAETWALPLAVAGAFFFVSTLVIGLRRTALTARGLAGSFFAFLLSVALSLVAVTLAWWAIQQLNANYRVFLMGTTYETTLYLLAFVALILALMAGLGALLLRRVRAENLALGKVAGLVPVVDTHDRVDLDTATLQRYLAEAVWFPTALPPSESVTWEPMDPTHARATLRDGRSTASLEFEFNDRGEIVRTATPTCGRDVDGVAVPTPWGGRYWNYVRVGDVMVPQEGEVAWLLLKEEMPYWRAQMRFAFDTTGQ